MLFILKLFLKNIKNLIPVNYFQSSYLAQWEEKVEITHLVLKDLISVRGSTANKAWEKQRKQRSKQLFVKENKDR